MKLTQLVLGLMLLTVSSYAGESYKKIYFEAEEKIDVKTLTEVLKEVDTIPPLKGQPVVLTLSATWCFACHRVQPEMDRLAKRYPHVKFLYVYIGSDESIIREKSGETALIETIDFQENVANDFSSKTIPRILSLPKTFLIKPNGALVSEGSPSLDSYFAKITKFANKESRKMIPASSTPASSVFESAGGVVSE